MCKSRFSIEEIETETRCKRVDLGGVALLLLIAWVVIGAGIMTWLG